MTPTEPDLVTEEADRLVQIYERATALDPRDHLAKSRAEALEREIAVPLAEVVAAAIDVSRRIEATCEVGDTETGEWGDHLEQTGIRDAGSAIGRALADELWENVGNLCFTARSELRRAERLLRAPARDHAERLAACESARRKLRRAAAAVLDAIATAQGRAIPCGADLENEVEVAVAVRRMYAKFRRSLPACDPTDTAKVRRALRLSAVSLAVMIGSADFGEVRASDRALILGLQTRILAWARTGTSEADGARLYQDLVTAADLLHSINHRQELVAHDARALAAIRTALDGGGSAADVVAAVRAPLRALAGKSDLLDECLAEVLDGSAPAVALGRLRGAIDELDPRRSSEDAA